MTHFDVAGLPPEVLILVPGSTAPPMRCPAEVWAMLVVAVDVRDIDTVHGGEVALFAGAWIADQSPADGLYDGDLVIRLADSTASTPARPGNPATDVEMLLADRGRWQRVGQWCGVDDRWPHLVAPTAATVMGLHCRASDAVARPGSAVLPSSLPPAGWVRGGVTELLRAGLVKGAAPPGRPLG